MCCESNNRTGVFEQKAIPLLRFSIILTEITRRSRRRFSKVERCK